MPELTKAQITALINARDGGLRLGAITLTKREEWTIKELGLIYERESFEWDITKPGLAVLDFLQR